METKATSFRFSKTLRLLQASDYKRVFSRGKRINAKGLMALVVDNGLNHPRVGFAISSKHVKHAVKRNQIKRQAREFLRLNQSNLRPADIVILSSRQTAFSKKEQLKQSMQHIGRSLVNE